MLEITCNKLLDGSAPLFSVTFVDFNRKRREVMFTIRLVKVEYPYMMSLIDVVNAHRDLAKSETQYGPALGKHKDELRAQRRYEEVLDTMVFSVGIERMQNLEGKSKWDTELIPDEIKAKLRLYAHAYGDTGTTDSSWGSP